jgi:hypothetical protein
MSKTIARELPLVKRRIEALLAKIEANGCTPGEAAAATVKVEELITKYKLDPAAFRRSPTASAPSGTSTSRSRSPKASSAAVSSRGRGIGKLAEQLIVEHPDWAYRRIAEEVNARIDGAKASEKSVRWYASKMRKRGGLADPKTQLRP